MQLPPLRDPNRRKVRDEEEEDRLPQVEVCKRPKFVPRNKTVKELRNEKQIAVGPHFEEMLEEKVHIDGGSGRMIPLYSTFDECSLGPEVMDNIRVRNWGTPTAIQQAIIPLIRLKKSDFIANAPTGSGKTAAYMIPIIDELANYLDVTRRHREVNGWKFMRRPFAIVVLPTKELVEQIYNDAKTLAEGSGVEVVRTYGDMPMGMTKSHIARGCHILIMTTGRLYHFVTDGLILLNHVRYVILDEADRLLQAENLDTIRHVLCSSDMSPNRRMLLFSATFSESTMMVAHELLRPGYFVVQIGGANRAVSSIKQRFIRLGRYEKQAYLLALLLKVAKLTEKPDGSKCYSLDKTLIFVGHKREANRLAVCLCLNGFSATNLNGDRTLQQRHEAMEQYSKGMYDILVSTDVASRGLNIPDVTHVINYDLPERDENLESYVHRVGRTGRVGNEGKATSFFDPSANSDHAFFYIEKLQGVDQRVPPFLKDISEGTAEGVRMRFALADDPFAKLRAYQFYLGETPLHSKGREKAGARRDGEEVLQSEGEESQDVDDLQF